MKRAKTSTTALNYLADVAQRAKGSRPVPVHDGSKWKTAIAAILLVQDGIVFLPEGKVDGDSGRFQDIQAAQILEDVDQRYTIELRFRDEHTARATVVLHETVFFMMVFAALANGGIPCHFGFTSERLRALGAQ
jgi:hypothetical protein